MQSIYQLYESSPRPLCVFIGSGLSVPEPSCLPLSKEVVTSLLNLDWVAGDEVFPIPKPQIEGSDLCKIRFEHMLSIFNEWGKHDLGHLLYQFAEAPANWYHRRIAKLCQSQIIKCIITTNFDLCLEKALSDQDLIYNVVVTEDDTYSNESNVINIFKIHGTIELRENRYYTRGLVATLESMSRGLETWKRQLLLKLLDQYTLVFLGYGGFDSYDINPILYEYSGSYLFWVAHTSNDEDKPISSEVSSILAKSEYPAPLQLDTAAFLGGKPLPRREKQFKFKPTYDLENLGHPSVFVGRVLESVGDYESAMRYYETVLEKSTGSRYWMIEILSLIRAKAVALYELGKYENAEMVLLQATALLVGYMERIESDGRTPEELKREIFFDQSLLIWEELALVQTQLDQMEEAKESIESAFDSLKQLAFSNEVTKLRTECRLLLNRSSIKLDFLRRQDNPDPGEYLMAIKDLKKACEMKRTIGDETGLIIGLSLLSQFYIDLHEGQLAEYTLLEMLSEMQKLKTPFGERLLQQATDCLSMFVFLQLTHDRSVNLAKFLTNESNTVLQFKNRIRDLLIDEVHKSANQALLHILRDEEILKTFNKLKEEISEWNER